MTLDASQKSAFETGLNLGDPNSTKTQAGQGFTKNPMRLYCRLFKRTQVVAF